MSNCYERMVPKTFSFLASVSLPEIDESKPAVNINLIFNGGNINTLFENRDKMCRNRLMSKYNQSIADGLSCLIKRTYYAQPALVPQNPSGCGLCNFELINLPEDQWSWDFTSGGENSSGTGFGQILLFSDYNGTPIEELNFSPLAAVQNVNLNPGSRACQETSQQLTIGLETECQLPDPPYSPCFWTQWITFNFSNFKIGANTASAEYYGTTASASININLT